MRIIDPYVMELDREAASTRKFLERVPAEKLAWAPHPKSMTLGKLAMHLATLPNWALSLKDDRFDLGVNKVDVPAAPGTAAEIVAIFDRSVAEAKKVLSGFDDAAAMGAWTLLMNGRTIFSMPRVAVVRNMLLNHAVHHRGQLSVFLRLLDVPVPGPYGPSADENPFG